jgi:MFS family permease
MRATAQRDVAIICSGAVLRSFSTGLIGVVFGVYLFRSGYDSLYVGAATGAGLAGAAVATSITTFRGDIFGRRRCLTVLAFLWTIGGIGLAIVHSFTILLVLIFLGMVNAMGTDRSAAYALEQAVLPALVSDQKRTWTMSWYHLFLDVGGALGALAAGLPVLITRSEHISLRQAYGFLFVGYAMLGVVSACLYWFLSPMVENSTFGANVAEPIAPESKRRLYRLAGLFAIDSFGGGLLTDALVAYWFFRRFGVPEQELGYLFFLIHALNAFSHLGAAWLAQRIGLLKTMVITHLPSSLFLILVPFAPSFPAAAGLLLCREALVEMDVPTRQSYVAAIVRTSERTFAAGVTNLSRNIFWACSAAVAGALMQDVALGAPLVVGGGLKIGYDLILYSKFAHIRPPEEQNTRFVKPLGRPTVNSKFGG